MFKDIGRLITFLDVLYYVGDMLYKKALRYTGVTAFVSLLGYLGNFLPGIDTYSGKVALALPLVVGSVMLVGGLALKSIPNLMAVRAMNVAQAQDLDLMEDYRKSRETEHLESLWERVFQFEWAVGTAASRVCCHPEEAPPEIVHQNNLPGDPVQRGRLEFLARARFGLARPQPQTRQRYHLGIDLRFLEDWRNGAYFDRQDVKLLEQFDGSATLEAIKREVSYGRWAALCDLPAKTLQRFWITMITRAIAMQVGDSISWFNREYDTDYFNAQVLLWPGEDRQPWLEQFPQAGEELRERRRLILARVFGEDDRTARRMLERIVLPSFWLATKLRAQYDPEYLDGTIGYDLLADLEGAGIAASRIKAYRSLARQTVEQQEALRPWLERYRPEILAKENGEELRAVRIALHLDRARVGKAIRGSVEDSNARERFAAEVLPAVDQAGRRRAEFSARLVGLRVHHELTRLHRLEYLCLLDALRNGT